MRVIRDFNEIYATEEDPWKIGDADSERYNLYHERLSALARKRGSLLDIGCGFGAFTARFKNDFDTLTGVELSVEAIEKGRGRFPFIEFIAGSADNLGAAVADDRIFDCIIFSDCICYLDETGRNAALRWIAAHLAPDGLALIAGYSPGGAYLNFEEMQSLISRYFAIESTLALETEHALFFSRPQRRLIALTVDYETWQPIPDGETIDWDDDVFQPAAKLMELGEAANAKITFFAEMGEYFWLKENQPELAARMEAQWREAARRGHDVQLHLHPSWLPECGAKCENGVWLWDRTKRKADDYPFDLTELISRCKNALEAAIQPEVPTYRVTSFRAGTYQIQPFRRLYDALTANEIYCDSSVFSGGVSEERGYDFQLAYSRHQPYFAGAFDPQLKAPPSENGIVEIPIFTYAPGERWFLDGDEAGKLASRLTEYLTRRAALIPACETLRKRRRTQNRLVRVYSRLRPVRHRLNRALPKSLSHALMEYPPEKLSSSETYLLIGHTKGRHDWDAIGRNLKTLQADGRFEFVTLSQMAGTAREELQARLRGTADEEAAYQVKREYHAVMGEDRNYEQSYYLQNKVPLDRKRLLDFGCASGYWSERLASLYPNLEVVGVDCGADFIKKANDRYRSARVSFQVADFAALPFKDAEFDAIYADNTLEHGFDVTQTLREAYRVLSPGGVLLAALPSDARNPVRVCDNHTWKTAPHDVRMRLEAAGFVNIVIEEIDTFRQFGMAPYPPSNDRMLYVTAWKRPHAFTQRERAMEAMDFVYRALSPEKSSESNDAIEILAGGAAYCWGSALVLGQLLEREGFDVRWVTMLADNHPRGRGEAQTDSHEVLQVMLDSSPAILDPMANTLISGSLEDVLKNPAIAAPKVNPDMRYAERGYHLYDTEFWYSRVVKYVLRRDPLSAVRRWHWRRNQK